MKIFGILLVLFLSSCLPEENSSEVKLVDKLVDITYVDGFRDTIKVIMPENSSIRMVKYTRNSTLPYLLIDKSFPVSPMIEESFGVIRYKVLN